MVRVSEVLCGILCGPCICLYIGLTACFCPSRLHRRRYVSDEKRRFERRQKTAPRPQVTRKRALTLPLPEPGKTEATEVQEVEVPQKTFDQMQSQLLRLPLELRESIYQAVLGDTTYHIIHKDKKLGYLRCKARSVAQCPVSFKDTDGHRMGRDSCWGVLDNDGIWAGWRRKEEPTDGDLLPFLRTCRQVYSESIKLLYSRNVFSFNDLDTFRHFTNSILPHRLHAIKSLELTWSFKWPYFDDFAQRVLEMILFPPHDEASWDETWRIIAGMEGLQRLFVRIQSGDGLALAEHEAKVLQPLRRMDAGKLKSFVVELPWKRVMPEDVQEPDVEQEHQGPFRIVRKRKSDEFFGDTGDQDPY